jgi:hypothetical protein
VRNAVVNGEGWCPLALLLAWQAEGVLFHKARTCGTPPTSVHTVFGCITSLMFRLVPMHVQPSAARITTSARSSLRH